MKVHRFCSIIHTKGMNYMDKKSFIWSLFLIVLGIAFQFTLLLEEKQIWLSIVGSFFLCLGITGVVYSFKFGGHGYIDNTSTKDIKDKLIDEYKFCDLNYAYELVKVFYSNNNKKRLIFIRDDNNIVIARKQMFIVYYDDRAKNPIWIGEWVNESGKNSFYADINIAVKEWEKELEKDYVELSLEEIPPIDLLKNPEFIAEIEWIKEKDGGRKTIPYGNRYMPQIVIHKKNKNEPLHSIFLRNTGVIDKYKTIAFVKYVYDSAPNDLYENLVFDICEGSRKVAIGTIKSKRENIDF